MFKNITLLLVDTIIGSLLASIALQVLLLSLLTGMNKDEENIPEPIIVSTAPMTTPLSTSSLLTLGIVLFTLHTNTSSVECN